MTVLFQKVVPDYYKVNGTFNSFSMQGSVTQKYPSILILISCACHFCHKVKTKTREGNILLSYPHITGHIDSDFNLTAKRT